MALALLYCYHYGPRDCLQKITLGRSGASGHHRNKYVFGSIAMTTIHYSPPQLSVCKL